MHKPLTILPVPPKLICCRSHATWRALEPQEWHYVHPFTSILPLIFSFLPQVLKSMPQIHNLYTHPNPSNPKPQTNPTNENREIHRNPRKIPRISSPKSPLIIIIIRLLRSARRNPARDHSSRAEAIPIRNPPRCNPRFPPQAEARRGRIRTSVQGMWNSYNSCLLFSPKGWCLCVCFCDFCLIWKKKKKWRESWRTGERLQWRSFVEGRSKGGGSLRTRRGCCRVCSTRTWWICSGTARTAQISFWCMNMWLTRALTSCSFLVSHDATIKKKKSIPFWCLSLVFHLILMTIWSNLVVNDKSYRDLCRNWWLVRWALLNDY